MFTLVCRRLLPSGMAGLVLLAALMLGFAAPMPAAAQETREKAECGRGLYLSNGHCCARGTVWNGKRCLRRSGLRPACLGPNDPNCDVRSRRRCPSGYYGRWPNCRSANVCPSGMVGAPPNCNRIGGRSRVSEPCPPGTTGVPPLCRRIGRRGCPPGWIRTAAGCIPMQSSRPVYRPNIGAPQRPLAAPQVGIGASRRPIWR